MTVYPIESFEDFERIINSGKVAIIDFWATWCGPCRLMSPIFAKFSEFPEFKDIEFYKVDTDAQERIAYELQIRSMPSFMAFHNGKKTKEFAGAHPMRLQEMIASQLVHTKPAETPSSTTTAETPKPAESTQTSSTTTTSTTATTTTTSETPKSSDTSVKTDAPSESPALNGTPVDTSKPAAAATVSAEPPIEISDTVTSAPPKPAQVPEPQL